VLGKYGSCQGHTTVKKGHVCMLCGKFVAAMVSWLCIKYATVVISV